MAIIRNADGLIMTVPDSVAGDYTEQGWQDLSTPEPEVKSKRSRKKTDE